MASVDDFTAIIVPRGLASLVAEAIRLEGILMHDGASNQAQEVRQALSALETDLQALAVDTAAEATGYVKDYEYISRVRDMSGVWGQKGLNDYVGESEALPVPGAVGINNEQVLEDQDMGWWRVNEFGWHGSYEIRGWFFSAGGGPSRPDPSRFREDPTFGASDAGMIGTVTQQPAREFVKDGFNAAYQQWLPKHKDIKRRFINRVQRAVASAPPPRRP